MSEPENFLTRWSRRKAETSEEDRHEQDAAPAVAPEVEARASEDQKSDTAGAETESDATTPAFDPTTLPPIESIGAGTDIGAFLKAGVPAEMTRAALRRAWATDPTIRDFIGLAENSWDFTAPNAILGFGPLSAEDALRAMGQLTGAAKKVVEQIDAISPPAESVQAKLPLKEPDTTEQLAGRAKDQFKQNADINSDASNSLQCDKENIAPQQNEIESNENSLPTRRSHGGALPE
jgi:hypothetical protein